MGCADGRDCKGHLSTHVQSKVHAFPSAGRCKHPLPSSAPPPPLRGVVVRVPACGKPGTKEAHKPGDHSRQYEKNQRCDNSATQAGQSPAKTCCVRTGIAWHLLRYIAKYVGHCFCCETCQEAQPAIHRDLTGDEPGSKVDD